MPTVTKFWLLNLVFQRLNRYTVYLSVFVSVYCVVAAGRQNFPAAMNKVSITSLDCSLWFLVLLQAGEKRISELKQTLSSLPPLDTDGQLSDMLPYYYTVTELRATTESLQV